MTPDMQIVLYIALAVLVVIYFIVRCGKRSRNAHFLKKIRRGKFIHYEKFEENWIAENGRSTHEGYKYNDCSGCYVILIFEKKVHFGRFGSYDNIYIGQSVNVYQRVHNHFCGKGKGDVYADIKYGMQAYVQIIPCKVKRLNRLEKRLIEAFNATESYNRTRGGAKITKR